MCLIHSLCGIILFCIKFALPLCLWVGCCLVRIRGFMEEDKFKLFHLAQQGESSRDGQDVRE